jgi:two-component system, cell cycle response regulator DivK
VTKETHFDGNAVAKLMQIGGNVFACEMIGVFLSNVPKSVLEAEAAAAAGDDATVQRIGHSLKSTAAQFGALAMREAAVALEDAARASQRDRYPALALGVKSAFVEVRSLLESERSRLLPSRIIAVVEDNPDNRLLVRALLQDLYKVVAYETGVEALNAFRGQRPDLVLLDVSLPGMDGIEVLQKIRGDPALRSLPVIALTAHAMEGDREAYLRAGFDGYVSKPILDESVLLDKVKTLLTL